MLKMKAYLKFGFQITRIFIILKFLEALEKENVTSSLKSVYILYRHGDRSPIKFYPYDSYKEHYKKYWPEGLGQLTKKGKYMEYELGTWLRKRYNKFISPVFVPEEIEIFSTDVDRTLMSAECVLASFYYPNNDTKFDNLIWWTPTPIHTAPAGDDKLLNVDEACPRIEDEERKMKQLPEVKKFVNEHLELFKFLSEKVGETINSVREAGYLFDTMKIEKLYGLKLPEWAEEKFHILKKIEDFSFVMHAFSKELKRLRGGPLVNHILSNMRKTIAKEEVKKLYMFSAHDSTVATLLSSLGIFNNKSPPYAATVIIELHEINEKYIVKMFYQNDTSLSRPPHELKLPDCSVDCPLERWGSLVESAIPTDWEAECLVVRKERDFYYLLLFSGLSFSLGLCCFLVATLGLVLFRKYYRLVVGTNGYEPI